MIVACIRIPGAQERHQSARVPETRISVELMEVQNVEHATIPLRVQDPGNATLVLMVRDVDATLARVKQANAPIVTPGGKPVTLADGTRAVLVRDIDSRFIELRQPASLPETPAGNVVDMRLSIAVNDLTRTTQAYREVLGFTVDGETAFAADAPTRALTGLAKAEIRRARIQAPGSMLWIELVEFKGVDRMPLRMRIQDRGAARLQLRAQNVDALVAKLKSAGFTVVSQGGGRGADSPEPQRGARRRSEQLFPDAVRAVRRLHVDSSPSAALTESQLRRPCHQPRRSWHGLFHGRARHAAC